MSVGFSYNSHPQLCPFNQGVAQLFHIKMNIDITIPNDQKAIRLDSYISTRFDFCSRKKATQLIIEQDILVNQLCKKPGYKITPGDRITGTILQTEPEVSVLPENIAVDIVFEDEHIIVLNKQSGMVVHPASGNLSGTLVNALLHHCPAIGNVGDDKFRAGIVHRLDKDTSGLMVVAKTCHALTFLQKEFKQRRVEKKYLALIEGNIKGDSGEIDLPIGRHPVKRKQMSVNHKAGKPAISCWTVKKRFISATLVEVLLKTGRTHQIRVHLYAIDHPLIGDPVYQFRRNRKKNRLASRQMLHSFKLSFRHPYSGRRVKFKADPSEDFIRTMNSAHRHG
ncbi:MAG: RluA family pseudouridine synthase [Desulfobacula sp.]|nr:RluA family pseudouridine synthase [Desulfobacula sp.]